MLGVIIALPGFSVARITPEVPRPLAGEPQAIVGEQYTAFATDEPHQPNPGFFLGTATRLADGSLGLTVAATSLLAAGVVFPVMAVSFKAFPANTDFILIGDNGSQTYPLSAGDSVEFFGIDMNQLWFKANSGVQWMAHLALH